jgi:hypothetical protein
MVMLHKIENNADVERIAAGTAQFPDRDGFAILENVAASMEIAEIGRGVARVQQG